MSARVRLITDDLLFGSKVEAMIRAAGLDLAAADELEAALTIVDLTDSDTDTAAAVAQAQSNTGPVLGFYAHTDDEVRRTALAAGIDKIVPRSRMMREGPELITAMISQ